MSDYSCDGSFIKMPTKQVAELAQHVYFGWEKYLTVIEL
jgi:hypothetical protein